MKQAKLAQDTESTAANIRLHLVSNEDYLLLLARDRADGVLDSKTFQERASQYVANHPEMIAINWVDAKYVITDVVPLEPNKQIIGLQLSLPEPYRASRLATETRQPEYTHPFVVIQGDPPAFELWVPVFHNNTFLGMLGGIYSYKKLLQTLVNAQVLGTAAVNIVTVSGETLFGLPATGAVDEKLVQQASLTAPDNGGLLQFKGYGAGIMEWSLWAFEFLSVVFAIGIFYVLWRLRQETEISRRAYEIEQKTRKYAEEFINSANAIVVCLDLEGKVTVFNEAVEKITGYKRNEVIGRNWFELVAPRARFPKVWEALEEFQKQGKFIMGDFESPILTKDGRERIIEWRNSDLQDDGKVIGTISYGTDITERKKSEDILLERTKELAEKTEEAWNNERAALNIAADLKDEEEKLIFEKTVAENLANDLNKFKLALDNASDQVTITDPEGMVIYANSAVMKVAGYMPEEVVGKKAGELWKLPMPSEYYKQLWHTIRDEKKSFIGEIQNRRKNGEIYTALFNVSPVLDTNGNIIFYVSLERDITKEKDIDKAKSEFVSLASHQMRTPLTAINWYTEMLLDGDAGKLNEKQENYFHAIYTAAGQMNDILKSFLHILRLETGTVLSNPVSVNLEEALRTTLKELQLEIEKKHLRIVEQYQVSLPSLVTDPEMLHVVLQNLLSNAAKYTPEKGDVTVALESVKKGAVVAGQTTGRDSLLVNITDTGIGIPKINHDKIFTKFFRADNAKRWDPNGNGIGLYMTHRMVDILGGTIWFTSEEGKGTTFSVLIPLGVKKS